MSAQAPALMIGSSVTMDTLFNLRCLLLQPQSRAHSSTCMPVNALGTHALHAYSLAQHC